MAALDELGVGDVVRLNGGTLRMTVAEVKAEDDLILCNWHDQNDDCLESEFDPRMLTLVRKADA